MNSPVVPPAPSVLPPAPPAPPTPSVNTQTNSLREEDPHIGIATEHQSGGIGKKPKWFWVLIGSGILGVIVLILVGAFFFFRKPPDIQQQVTIRSFEDCINNPKSTISTEKPLVCTTATGQRFEEPAALELVNVTPTPKPNLETLVAVTPSPVIAFADQLKGWLTYEDPVYGFRLKYPPQNYSVTEENLAQNQQVLIEPAKQTFAKQHPDTQPPEVLAAITVQDAIVQSQISKILQTDPIHGPDLFTGPNRFKYPVQPLRMWILNNPQKLSVAEWFQANQYYPYSTFAVTPASQTYAPTTPMTVTGTSGAFFTTKSVEGDDKLKFALVPKDDKMYLFVLEGNPVVNSTADRILSTFEFVVH